MPEQADDLGYRELLFICQVATMLPIVAFLNQTIPGVESGGLRWSQALGACLGGNGTMIGASANVVTVGMVEKAGYQISFLSSLKPVSCPCSSRSPSA